MTPHSLVLRAFGVLALLVSMSAWAQPYDYHVYIDSDQRSTTGCTVTGGGQSFVGADFRLTVTVSGNPPRVTGRTLAACDGGTFGAGNALGANYPVGLNNGLPLAGGAFADVIELSVARTQLPGVEPLVRIGFGAVSASGSIDVLYTANGQVGGPAMVVGFAALIPTLGFFGGLLLALALGALALRALKHNRRLAQMLLVGAFFSAGFAAWAANFISDGQVGDWSGSSPVGMDAIGDSVPNLSATDIVGAFAADENRNLYFRIDVVDAENRPPVAVGDAYTTLEDTQLSIAAPGVLANDSDPDGNPITAQLVSGPTRGTLVLNANGSFTYTPNANANGSDSFTYNAFDGQVTSLAPATVTIAITPVNDVPVFTVGSSQTVLEDAGAQTVNPWASGIDDGDPEVTQILSFEITNNSNAALFSAGPAVSPTGVLTYTPAANANGSATITLRLVDDGGTANGGVDTSATQSFTITVTAVNDAPSFTASNPPTVLEDAGAQSIPNWATFSAGPPDEAGQTVLGYQISAISNAALFSAPPAVANNGTLTYTPAANANGSSTFTVRVQDSGGTANGGIDLSAPQTFTITVTGINDPPVFVAGPNQTVLEDSGAQTVNPWATGIDDGDPEVTQTLTFIVTNNSNAALFSAGPAISPTGVLTYTPAANANGSATITLRLEDNGSNTPPNVNTSATQTFTITVTAVNDAPSFVKGPDQTVNEDAPAQTVNPWATAISAGPPDEAGQTLTFNVTGNSNAALFSAQPAISPTGVLTYTPAANANGVATITLTLSDNGSNTPPNVNTSAAQTFTISVAAVNDAPVNTVPGAQQTGDTTPLVFSTANTNAISVADIDAGAGIVQMSFGTGAPANGTLTLANPGGVLTTLVGNGSELVVATGTLAALNTALNGPAGSLTYTPVVGTSAARTLTVISNDQGNTGSGGALIDSDSITINVDAAPVVTSTPANGATVANNAAITVNFNEPVNVIAGITLNCGGAIALGGTTGANVSSLNLTYAAPLPAGSCTLTVPALSVSDVDPIDPPNNPVANYVATFTVDAAPAVTTTSPGNGATTANNIDLIVNFDEPVTFDATSFTLECPAGSPFAGGFAVSGSGTTTATINPTGDLPAGACTLVVLAANISDVDPFDPPQNPVANSTINFTVDAAPAFVSATPAAAAVVGTGQTVSFTFDENVDNLGGAITLNCGSAVAGTISGGGTPTLTFTPTNPLTAGASCTATAVAAQIGDSDAIDPPQNPLANVVRNFSVDAAPTVTTTTPSNGDVDVPLAGVVVFNFSEAVTFNVASFSYTCGVAVPFTVAGSGTSTATLTPTGPLPINTLCTVTALAAGISDVDAADPPDNLAANFVLSFTSVNDNPPTVTASTPANGAVVANNTPLGISFSENINATAGSVTLTCGAGNLITGGTVGANVGSLTPTYAPPLPNGATCTLTVFAANITDADLIDPPDNMLANFVATFTVDAAPSVTTVSPANGASNLATNTTITVNFSEAVNIAAGGITLNCGAPVTFNAGPLPASNVSTITLTPSAALPEGATCNGTVLAASVTDVDAFDPPDQMVANFSWSFTTDAAPTVTGVTPAEAAVVATNQLITANFSENVDLSASAFTLNCGGAVAFTSVPTLPATGTNTITLTPTGGLPQGSSCTFTVVAAQVSDSDLNDPPNNLAANFVRNFSVDAAPTVTATNPVNAAVGVGIADNLTVTFSEAVNFTASAFTLECPAATPIAFTVSGSGSNTATIDPTPATLPINTLCVFTVNAALVTDVDGVDPPDAGSGITTVSFTTVDDSAPSVTASTPANGATVADNTPLGISFSENINATAGSVTLSCGGPNLITGGTTGSNVASLTPTYAPPLPNGATCTLTVLAANITDADLIDPPDNMVANFVATFTVDAAPSVTTVSPANGASDLATSSTITVNFSEAVNIAAGGITLNCGAPVTFNAGPLPASNVSTITLTPSAALPEGATCNGTVLAASVTDVDAIDPPDTMAANFLWSFTTDAAPTVTSVTPAEAAIVATNQLITANFSENVDLSASAFTLNCGGAVAFTSVPTLPATGTNTITLTPTGGLPQGSSCTFTVVAAQVSDSDANDPPNNLAANFVRTFSVDAAPTVVSTTPANGASNVNPTSTISIDFSESMTFDTAANAANTSFDLECPAGSPTNFSVSSSSPNDPVVLDPLDNAVAGQTCTLTVRSGAASNLRDADAIDPPDNLLADFVATIGFGAIANDDAYMVTPHLTLDIGVAAPQGGGAVVNDILGAGSITGFGFAPACSGTAAGAQLDAGAANGRLTLNSNGSLNYQPPAAVVNTTRTFCYTVTGGDTANIVFTLQNTELAWFVDAAAAAGGIGTQARPFQTIAAVDAVDSANDSVFIEFNAAAYSTSGWTLLAGERVVGKGSGSTLAAISGITPVAGSAFPALGGAAPTITCSGVTCLTLATGNTLRGFVIGDSGATGTDLAGTGFGTLTVGELTLNGTGRALNLTTGTVSGNFVDVDAASGNNEGIRLDAVGGTWTVSNQVNIGNVLGNAVHIVNAPATASATLTGGLSINKASSGAAVNLATNNAAATIDLGVVGLSNSAGSGLVINTSPLTLTGVTGTISATAGPAINAVSANFVGGATLATVTSSGSAGNGIFLDTVSGNLIMNGGSIATAAGNDFDVNAGAATISYAGTITNTAARSVDITNRTGGTVTLSGAVSDTGTGINLVGNTGGTITFSGGISASTGANTAFNATGGGTVNVTGINTLATTTGIALNVVNTGIGASGLTFRSIAANGGSHGIILNNTGASGGLTVSGTGAAGTGGTIQNTTTRGASFIGAVNISLTNMNFTNAATNDFPAAPTGLSLGVNTADNASIHLQNVVGVTLTSLNINGSAEHGINGHNVQNFVLTNSTLVNLGNGPDEDGIHFYNMVGTCSITNTTISASGDDNLNIQNNNNLAGDLPQTTVSNITITGGNANAGVLGSGYLFGIRGTMNSTVVISGVTADNNFSGGIVADTFDTATSSFDIGNVVSINNNDGISLSSSSGNTRFDIHDNANISGNDFLPINILKAAFSTGGTLQGRIRNNTITVALGRPTDGIDVANRGGGTAAVAVTGNTINYGGTQLGINIAAGQDGAATHEVTVTGNTINITGTALQGILAQGILATPSGNGTSMCFDIGGAGALRNTINHVAGGTVNAGGDIRVRQRNGGPVRLPGYGGAAGDLAAVVAYLTGRNTLVSAPTATSDNSLYSGGGACVQPVFP